MHALQFLPVARSIYVCAGCHLRLSLCHSPHFWAIDCRGYKCSVVCSTRLACMQSQTACQRSHFLTVTSLLLPLSDTCAPATQVVYMSEPTSDSKAQVDVGSINDGRQLGARKQSRCHWSRCQQHLIVCHSTEWDHSYSFRHHVHCQQGFRQKCACTGKGPSRESR